MIRGERVSIRLFQEKDLDVYCRYISEIGEIGEFWPMHLYSEVSMRNRFKENGFWDQERGGSMAIADKDDELIGQLNLFKGIPYTDGFEIGYRMFRPEDRGKGYMTEALRLFTDYLFELKPINRLQVCFDLDNHASRIVAEKCGFISEGVLRGCIFHKGVYVDICITSMLRNEWVKRKSLPVSK